MRTGLRRVEWLQWLWRVVDDRCMAAGGGKSKKVQAPKTGLSNSQKTKLARKGKGKSQFKGKKKYKRK